MTENHVDKEKLHTRLVRGCINSQISRRIPYTKYNEEFCAHAVHHHMKIIDQHSKDLESASRITHGTETRPFELYRAELVMALLAEQVYKGKKRKAFFKVIGIIVYTILTTHYPDLRIDFNCIRPTQYVRKV